MARVLIIEDDGPMRALIRQVLERAGHEVEEARDGTAGIRAFVARPSDLVVVDLYLPETNGWETVRALQRRAPGVPFVIVSGGAALEGLHRGSPGTLEEARRFADFRILRKPFGCEALTVAVADLLGPDARAASGVAR